MKTYCFVVPWELGDPETDTARNFRLREAGNAIRNREYVDVQGDNDGAGLWLCLARLESIDRLGLCRGDVERASWVYDRGADWGVEWMKWLMQCADVQPLAIICCRGAALTSKFRLKSITKEGFQKKSKKGFSKVSPEIPAQGAASSPSAAAGACKYVTVPQAMLLHVLHVQCMQCFR